MGKKEWIKCKMTDRNIKKHINQEHIIKLLEQLEGKEKEELIEQINKIDFHPNHGAL